MHFFARGSTLVARSRGTGRSMCALYRARPAAGREAVFPCRPCALAPSARSLKGREKETCSPSFRGLAVLYAEPPGMSSGKSQIFFEFGRSCAPFFPSGQYSPFPLRVQAFQPPVSDAKGLPAHRFRAVLSQEIAAVRNGVKRPSHAVGIGHVLEDP